LIGTVDSNQIIVSPQMQGRIARLLVDEGTQVKQGDLIAVLDPSELEAEARAAAAMIDSMRSQVSATQATSVATHGSTSSNVLNAQSRLESARAQLLQAEATLQRTESDSRRTIELAKQGVASDQDRVQAESNLKAQLATVQSLKDQVSAANADLNTAVANTNQAQAAASTVQSTRGQLANAEAQLKEAEVRLGYTKIYAPVSGTVSVRAAREGEVLTSGQPIVTLVDLNDTWARAAIPETEADHIGLGDTLRIRLPGGTVTSGKVFYKSPEADFATQRDVSRRKRDIRTIVLKVRLDNPKGDYVPGMTAEVLVSPDQLKASASNATPTDKQQ
ncbi:MAG: efflux RND transporter periplasmic adaptor subunit, partial [Alloacidobacterium sp.]